MPADARTIVFLGPSLPLATARAILPDADYRPPAWRGDVYRCLCEAPAVIVLIDGEFHGRPSVWQRELVDALADGVTVLGASSMGALRAAELHTLGMAGHGDVFAWYRDGVIDADDEVALVYGPPELGWPAASEPLVNIRATAAAATAAGVLSAAEAEALVEAERRRHFPDRRPAAEAVAEALPHLPAARLALVRDWLAANRIDIKRRDAEACLRAAAALAPGRRAPDIAVPPPPSPLWGRARLAAEGVAEHPRGVTPQAVLARFGRSQEADTLSRRTAERRLLLLWAAETGLAVPPAEPLPATERPAGLPAGEWRRLRQEAAVVDAARHAGFALRGPDEAEAARALAARLRAPADDAALGTCWALVDWAGRHGIEAPAHALDSVEARLGTALPPAEAAALADWFLADWMIEHGPEYFGDAGFVAPVDLARLLHLEGGPLP